jgi:hypothetical protein
MREISIFAAVLTLIAVAAWAATPVEPLPSDTADVFQTLTNAI